MRYTRPLPLESEVRDASEAPKNAGMLVFMDESGDAGLRIAQGSSTHFVVVLVVFDDEHDAKAVDRRITLLRRELRLSSRFEFKFNKCQPPMRRAFLAAVAQYGFFYYGIVIAKSELYGEGFKVKESFYKYATQLVFLNAREHLEDARVYIDASGSKDFRRQINGYLKRRINLDRRHIDRVGFLDSAKSNLIQLADMVAGAVNRSFSPKEDAQNYIRIIQHREGHLQVWPRPQKKEKPKP